MLKNKQKNPYLLEKDVESVNTFYQSVFKKLNEKISKTPYNKKINITKDYIEFERVFSSKGVQGIVGLVRIKGVDASYPPVVFKVANEINRSIEHEYQILNELNTLGNFCPHFVKTLGIIEIPISSKFILKPDQTDLFHDDGETLPYHVMFLEYANKYPFYKLCQKSINKNILSSQILQVLIALEIAQIKKKFTHYDLHTSNILLQLCEKNSVFVYKISNQYYLVPTFGFFPLVIDTGISYSQCVENNSLMTTTYNYDHGFQSAIYDTLNDVHHFLLTAFYYIEDDKKIYSSISNKIKIILRHLPVLRKSGWKRLPHNLCKSVLDKIKEDCKIYKRFDVFHEYEYSSIDILNGLITLPFKDRGDSNFKECFPSFAVQYSSIIDVEDFSESDVLFVLKTIVDCVNKNRREYIYGKKEYAIEQYKKNFKNTVSEILKYNINYNIYYEKLISSAISLGQNMETIYYDQSQDHLDIIDDCYDKTIPKFPIDMYRYLEKNLTPHFELDKKTVVYFWNCDEEYNRKMSCEQLSQEILETINFSCFREKGLKLIREILK